MVLRWAETGDVQRVTYTRRFFGDLMLESILFIVTLIVGWFVWLYFTAKTSQSPAKRLLNVYILDTHTEQPITAGRVWVREVLVKNILFGILGNITFGIARLADYLWVFFGEDRQSLHDKIVSTVVVYAPFGLPELEKLTDRRAAQCPHPTLTPQWDSAEDMGNADKVARYMCDSCKTLLSREEWERLRQMGR